MSTVEIYFSLDQAWAEIDRMQGWRSWRRWLRPKLYAKRCRQFDTFWFELERRMKDYDAHRGEVVSSGQIHNGRAMTCGAICPSCERGGYDRRTARRH